MAKIDAPFTICRTMGGLTFYMWEGRNLVRKKSSLSRRKVLTSPRFERTRRFAGLMGRASKIGSTVYKALPEHWRQFWMYRAFTGEAMKLLKEGQYEEQIQALLMETYVRELTGKSHEAGAKRLLPLKATRTYQKKDTTYWKRKAEKAGKRKARRQLTLHYAGMLAKASRTASAVYGSLPVQERRYATYKELTGMAMHKLKEGVTECDVHFFLMKELIDKNEASRQKYGAGKGCRVIRMDGRSILLLKSS